MLITTGILIISHKKKIIFILKNNLIREDLNIILKNIQILVKVVSWLINVSYS